MASSVNARRRRRPAAAFRLYREYPQEPAAAPVTRGPLRPASRERLCRRPGQPSAAPPAGTPPWQASPGLQAAGFGAGMTGVRFIHATLLTGPRIPINPTRPNTFACRSCVRCRGIVWSIWTCMAAPGDRDRRWYVEEYDEYSKTTVTVSVTRSGLASSDPRVVSASPSPPGHPPTHVHAE